MRIRYRVCQECRDYDRYQPTYTLSDGSIAPLGPGEYMTTGASYGYCPKCHKGLSRREFKRLGPIPLEDLRAVDHNERHPWQWQRIDPYAVCDVPL